jgi:hypothetical protein
MAGDLILPNSDGFKVTFHNQRSNYDVSAKNVDSAEGREFVRELARTSATPKELRADAMPAEEVLDYAKWLPFAAKRYKISPRIEDYVVVNTPMIPSDIPNRNGVAFPLCELVKFREPPVNRIVYKAWVGCPTHEEHAADDYENALGIILDTSLKRIVNYGNGRHWMVMALLAFDKTKVQNEKRIQRMLNGEVNTYSMGANCQYFTCGLSGVRLDDPRYAARMAKAMEWDVVNDPLTQRPTMLFRNAHDLSADECSTVDDPAWAPALSDTLYQLA